MTRTLRSELTKLLTLRSVVVTLVLVVVLPIAFAAVSAPSIGEGIASNDPDLAPGVVPEAVGLEWVVLGQIGMIVLGVMAGGSELRSGQLLTSLTAVPQRGRLLGAKALAVAIVAFVAGLLAIPALSVVSQLGMGDVGVLHGGLPGTLVARWVGALVFWVAMALVALAVTTILRQTVLPLVLLIAVSQLSLMLVVLTTWSKVLPTVAGVQLFDPTSISAAYPGAALNRGAALGWVLVWVGALVAGAAVLFRRRDVSS